MMVGWTGLPGASKTTSLARTAINILYRNKKYHQKLLKRWKKNVLEIRKSGDPKWKEIAESNRPEPRQVFSNITFHPDVEKEFHGFIRYWTDIEHLAPIRNADVLIDEAMVYFDARSWEHMSLDIRRWLAQHRKFGVEIYFTAQEFMQIDIAFRRLVSHLFYLTKLVGSLDISATRPRPKFVWAFIRIQEIDPVRYDEENSKNENLSLLPRFQFITGSDVKVFDTTEEIKASKFPPLRHIIRYCEDPNCNFVKKLHV